MVIQLGPRLRNPVQQLAFLARGLNQRCHHLEQFQCEAMFPQKLQVKHYLHHLIKTRGRHCLKLGEPNLQLGGSTACVTPQDLKPCRAQNPGPVINPLRWSVNHQLQIRRTPKIGLGQRLIHQ